MVWWICGGCGAIINLIILFFFFYIYIWQCHPKKTAYRFTIVSHIFVKNLTQGYKPYFGDFVR